MVTLAFLQCHNHYNKRPVLKGMTAQVPELWWDSKELTSELGSNSVAGTIIYQILLIKCPVYYSCITVKSFHFKSTLQLNILKTVPSEKMA